jgi:glutamine amidotransferase
VQALHPADERFQRFTDEDRVIVSEPLSDLPGLWIEVPEATALIVQRGPDEHRPFRPQAPERQAEAVRPPAGPGASSATR